MKKKIFGISLLLLLIGATVAFADHYFSCGKSYPTATFRDENGIQRSITSFCVPSAPCPDCLERERQYFAQQRERNAERQREAEAQREREAAAQREREAEAQRQREAEHTREVLEWFYSFSE